MLTTTKFWLWLTSSVRLAPAWQVLEHFGTPEKAYFADRAEYETISDLSAEECLALSDKSVEKAENILADCQRLGVRILTWQDADYPERLRSIELPPMVLYVKGRPVRFDEEAMIAMAGTRHASPYGMYMARTFAREITEGGALVVTGVAKGCDQNAIMGAFDARGSVVAVLPGGVDVPFQSDGHGKLLYRDLARYGTLISEYPPGTPNQGEHFRMRNRVLTGLCLALLCVEAGKHSGTLQVAAYAREQDRTTFVVPARVDDVSARGTNELMCQGYALPVLSGRDILVHYTAMYPHLLRPAVPVSPFKAGKNPVKSAPKEVETPAAEPAGQPKDSKMGVDSGKGVDYIDVDTFDDSLTQEEQQIIRSIGSNVVTTEELIAETGLSASNLMATLTLLTIRGLVIPEDGGRFRCSRPM